jgi:hypothetical protein
MLNKLLKAIHTFRNYFLIFIIITFFYYLGLNPIDIGRYIKAELGFAQDVGMSTSVPENPFNKLALELKQKESNLNSREQELNKKEANLNDTWQPKLMVVLATGIIVLFLLILINYYFDFTRRREEKRKINEKNWK